MKKIFTKGIGLLVLLVFMIGFTAACGNREDDNQGGDDNPVVELSDIKTVLETATNNQDIKVSGVVYGVVGNGFYLADSEVGRIFVIKNANAGEKLAIGDKVSLSGQFSITNNFPQVKNVKDLKVESQGNAIPVKLETKSYAEINGLSKASRLNTYGAYVEVVGTLTKTASGSYSLLNDDENETLLIYSDSNTAALDSHVDDRLTLKLIVHNFSASQNKWQLSFVGTADEIQVTELPFEAMALKAKAHLDANVVTSVYGKLTLPAKHPQYASLTYTWSVEENAYLALDGNKVTITNPETDQQVKLTCRVSRGEEHADFEYTITIHAIVERSVHEFLADLPVTNASLAIVRGIVISISRNQSGTLRTYVLQDKDTKEVVTLDFYAEPLNELLGFNSPSVKALKLGDEVVVNASYRSKASGDRPTLIDATKVEVKSSGNPVVQDLENAIDCSTAEKASDLANNWINYTGKLIKFVNPFLNYSTTSAPGDTSFVRIGYSDAGNEAYGPEGKMRFLSLLLIGNNNNLGGPYWHTNLDLPLSGQGAKQCNVTIYGYCLYISDTIIQFVMPDLSCYVVEDEAKVKLDLQVNTPTSLTGGSTVKLLANHPLAGAITWTSSDPDLVDVTTGKVKDVEENSTVTLTAKYTLNDKIYELSFEVAIMKSVPLTVTEVLELSDGVEVKATGIVVGFASDGNSQESRKGIIVMDNATGKMIFVDGVGIRYGKTFDNGDYVDSTGAKIKVGDEVFFKGTFFQSTAAISSGPAQTSRKRVTVENNEVGEVTILSSGNTINYHTDSAILVDSSDKMAALVEDLDKIPYGQLIKLVGTEEHPIYLGGSSSKLPFNIKIYLKQATDNDGTKYNSRTFTLKSDVAQYILGDAKWYVNYLGIPGAFVGPNTTTASKEYVGEMYIVIGYSTSSYYQVQLVNVEGFNIRPKEVEAVKNFVLGFVPETIDAGETFPTLLATSHLTGDIKWTSSDSDVINLETKAVKAVTEDTTVTITGEFTYLGEKIVVTRAVKVLAPVVDPVTVKEVLALESASSVLVEGVVVGFGSDDNGTTAETTKVMVLMDNTSGDMVIVSGLNALTGTSFPNYKDAAEKDIKKGAQVKLSGTFTPSANRPVIDVSTGSIEVTAASVTLNFNKEKALKATTATELEAILTGATAPCAKLIKISGSTTNPLFIGGSSSKSLTECNYKLYMKEGATTGDDAKVGGKVLALNATMNVANAGEAWWSTYLPGVTGNFVAPSSSNPGVKVIGDIYLVITNIGNTYYRAMLVTDGTALQAFPTE